MLDVMDSLNIDCPKFPADYHGERMSNSGRGLGSDCRLGGRTTWVNRFSAVSDFSSGEGLKIMDGREAHHESI